MKDIKDYLHLYLGCDVQVTTDQYGLQGPPNVFKGILRGYTLDQWKQQELAPAIQVYISETTYYFYNIDQVKLILRPLSDMTEEEKKELNAMEQNNTSYPTMAYAMAPQLAFMLSKGFDLFNLIQDGLAIDKTKL